MVYGDAVRLAVLKSRWNAFGGGQGAIHGITFNSNKSRLKSFYSARYGPVKETTTAFSRLALSNTTRRKKRTRTARKAL